MIDSPRIEKLRISISPSQVHVSHSTSITIDMTLTDRNTLVPVCLCLNSWPAAQQSAHLEQYNRLQHISFSSATCDDDTDALHCNAYHTVLQHHVLHSTTLFYPRNFLDLQATLKLSYLWSGPTDHSYADRNMLRST